MQLSEYISSRNLSVQAFANSVGVTPEAVRLWLKRKRTPSSTQVEKIRKVTKGAVKPNDLFSPRPRKPEAA